MVIEKTLNGKNTRTKTGRFLTVYLTHIEHLDN